MNTKAKMCDKSKAERKNCISLSDIKGSIAHAPSGKRPRGRGRHVDILEQNAVEAESMV